MHKAWHISIDSSYLIGQLIMHLFNMYTFHTSEFELNLLSLQCWSWNQCSGHAESTEFPHCNLNFSSAVLDIGVLQQVGFCFVVTQGGIFCGYHCQIDNSKQTKTGCKNIKIV